MEEYKHASHHQKAITLKRAQCVFAGPHLIQIPSANLGNHFCVISSPLFFILFLSLTLLQVSGTMDQLRHALDIFISRLSEF